MSHRWVMRAALFRDGRVLSEPFMKLPSKRELPDYYEIIKKPMDIRKILSRIDEGRVSSLCVERLLCVRQKPRGLRRTALNSLL